MHFCNSLSAIEEKVLHDNSGGAQEWQSVATTLIEVATVPREKNHQGTRKKTNSHGHVRARIARDHGVRQHTVKMQFDAFLIGLSQ